MRAKIEVGEFDLLSSGSLQFDQRQRLLETRTKQPVQGVVNQCLNDRIAHMLNAKDNWSQRFKESESFRNPATVDNFIHDLKSLDENGSNDPRDQRVVEFVEQIAERMIKS